MSESSFQVAVGAPGFRVGIRCDDGEIIAIHYIAPGPEIPPQNGLAAEARRQVLTYLDDPGAALDLPLRPAGTRFQRLVWEQISRIPTHQTRTYGELAKALDSAPRAVGQACGANPYPLIVPCHRVIAAHGGLGGFARQNGGFLLDVKRWLLAHEGRR